MNGEITVIGLGPSGPELVTTAALNAIEAHRHQFLRTSRHPSAVLMDGAAVSFDAIYESAESLSEVYRGIVDALISAATAHGEVLYAVPGSPLVAEHTVELLREQCPAAGVTLIVQPALSYLDVAGAALGVDPLAAGVRMVDGHRFAAEAAGERGPLLVAQCDSVQVLSDIKLSFDTDEPERVTVLWHLGLPEERVVDLPWHELDHFADADHLTSLWIASLAAPVGAELVRFHELVRTLREQCPWDQEQTHHSLTRHLLEETYEVLEAIEALDVDSGQGSEHFCEELGDLLFQIFFHAVIASEEGWFTVADVAQGIHDKLVSRHPHVFPPTSGPGTVLADSDGLVRADTSEQVLTNWEQIKQAEKGHRSLMDGIAGNLPALAYAVKVQRKAASVGFDWPDVHGALPKIGEELVELTEVLHDSVARREELGDLLFAICNVARHLDVDPEAALRAASAKFRGRFSSVEALVEADGLELRSLDLDALDAYWDKVKLQQR
ncbi:MAG: nucleoside triphosphate pyrophosphohydrolase [Acidimicrobiia bacterium]